MKTKILFLVMLYYITQIICVSCSSHSFTKEDYIRDYEFWMNDLKQNYKHYDDEDWVKVQEEFEKFSEIEFSKFEKHLTKEERGKIANLTGQYYAVFAKYKLTRIKRKINGLWDNAEGVFKELKKK